MLTVHPRGRGAVLLVAGVVMLHAWLISSWSVPLPQPRASLGQAVAVRVVTEPAGSRLARSDPPRGAITPGGVPSDKAAAPEAAAVPAAAAGVQRRREGASAVPAPGRIERARAADPVARKAAAAPEPPLAAAPQPESTDDPSAYSPQAAPRYRTRPPPATTLRYALRRGTSVGTAVLDWAPDADGYRLTFEADAGSPWAQASVGGFDADGLAPQRHTDARGRRGTAATNFRRDEAAVSFSASARQVALVGGVQDRLSWLIQLAAVLEGEPERREPGAAILLPVAGSRGELEVWALRNEGTEEVSTQSGPRPALRLSRERTGIRDAGLDIWVDPERHHLPLRWWVRSPLGDTVLEFELLEAHPGP